MKPGRNYGETLGDQLPVMKNVPKMVTKSVPTRMKAAMVLIPLGIGHPVGFVICRCFGAIS
jgi:hypothetical protein